MTSSCCRVSADAIGGCATPGYAIVGVSNQPAAAKGVVSLQQLEAVQFACR